MNETLQHALKKYVLAALFGTIGGFITVLVVLLLDEGIKLIWEHAFGIDPSAPTQTAMVFVTMLVATLLVGFMVNRYGKTKAGLEELLHEILQEGTVKWRKLPKALLMAFPSLLSGASLGPEAPAAIASIGATSFIADKQRMNTDDTQNANIAAYSGMLGAVLSSPFLSPAMIAESAKSSVEKMRALLTTSVIASAFGTATFFFVFGQIFVFHLPEQTYAGSGYVELLVAFVIGLGGALFGAAMAKVLALTNKAFDAVAKNDTQLVIITGVVVSVLMFIMPITMFSGQHTLDNLFAYGVSAGFFGLLLAAIIKLASTGLLIRAGFVGGAVFPAIFAGAAFGLALNQLFNVSPMAAAGAATVGLLAVLLKQPVSAAILTLLIFGFNSGAVVACGLAGAMLVFLMTPKKSQ